MPDKTPPRYQPKIRSAPKVRQLYWCQYPEDAHLPEFWKIRPVIIVSYKNSLYGTVTIVPCTTKNQTRNKWAFPLDTTINGKKGWAICDKLSNVAVSRLTPNKGKTPRLDEDEFNNMLEIILNWLPKFQSQKTKGS